MPNTRFSSKFDSIPPRKELLLVRYDAVNPFVSLGKTPSRLNVRPLCFASANGRFDTVRFGWIPHVCANRFSSAARKWVVTHNRPNVLHYGGTTGLFCNRLEFRSPGGQRGPLRWDAQNDWSDKVVTFPLHYESLWATLSKFGIRFHVVSNVLARICYGQFPVRLDAFHPGFADQNIRFDAIPQEYLADFCNRLDAVGCAYATCPAHKQAFVRPGWRIVAKNIENGQVLDLGFIDAESENPSLENVFLPDGDYEIHVLTSSLFWKDTCDTTIRTISVRPGEEVSPLPTIYHLRSSISQGETTIHWSANRSGVSDCVFGIWYSTASPVSTDGPPDTTVWYSSELTEYQTSFSQKSPCFVAVAVMKPGDEPEMGKVHELFLPWNNVPPHCPDDVVVLDMPLPAYDPNILTIEQENPDLSLWS